MRERPYNARFGGPQQVRLKPQTGHIELDVDMNPNTGHFNKYQGLRWGDALATSRDIHNKTGTYGPAAGFSGLRARQPGTRRELKDAADRDMDISNDLVGFFEADDKGKVMKLQTLGGQITRHDAPEDAGKPLYFVGAFRENQLHLTKVDGTAQMRPQFHHLDAEEQRARLANARGEPADGRQADARGLLQRHKNETEAEKGKLEDRTKRMLHAAESEEWVNLAYVDEEAHEAYEMFHHRMFVKDIDGVPRLKSAWEDEEYMDAISAPRRESPNRKRKRAPRRRGTADTDAEGVEPVEGG